MSIYTATINDCQAIVDALYVRYKNSRSGNSTLRDRYRSDWLNASNILSSIREYIQENNTEKINSYVDDLNAYSDLVGISNADYITPEQQDVGNGTYLANNSDDFESAIDRVNELSQESGLEYTLIIDRDITISGDPRVIDVDVPVEIRNGAKIITPLVERDIEGGTNPIEGTVEENYIQIEFSNSFTSSPIKQCFEGDGLIWFKFQSVQEIYGSWWGLTYGAASSTVQTANWRAFQQSIFCLTYNTSNSATNKLRLGAGDLRINRPIVICRSNLDNEPFFTGKRREFGFGAVQIDIRGNMRIKHEFNEGNATNIKYTAKWGALFIGQGLRNTLISDLRIEGSNNPKDRDDEWIPEGYVDNSNTLKTFLRPDTGYDSSTNYWINSDLVYEEKKPYTAILTDPFRDAREDGAYALVNTDVSTIDLYYSETGIGGQNSWNVNLESMHIRWFMEGIVIGLTGQLNDTYIYREVMFDQVHTGIVHCQDQSRDCKAYDIMAYNGVWAMVSNSRHARGNGGVTPEIISAHSAGGLKYFHVGRRTDGNINFNNIYCESIYAIGLTSTADWVYDGELYNSYSNSIHVAEYASTISNSTFKMDGDRTYEISGETCYLLRPPRVSGFNIHNSSIGLYGAGILNKLCMIEYAWCNFSGTTKSDTDPMIPFDYGWNSIGRGTLRRNTGRISASLMQDQPIQDVPKGYNTGFAGGIIFDSREQLPWDMKYYEFDETVTSRESDNFTASMNDTRKVITLDFVADWYKVGDIVSIGRSGFYGVCVVVEKSETQTVVAAFSSDGWEEIKDRYTDELLDIDIIRIRKWTKNESITPFYASIDGDQLSIEHYCGMGDNNSDSKVNKVRTNYALILGDGKIYYVNAFDDENDIITLDRGYDSGGTDEFWVEGLFPNFKAVRFFNARELEGSVYQRSCFYKEGQRYDYVDVNGEKTTDHVVCVKTGDFLSSTTNIDKKANFLRYNSSGRLTHFIDGENSSGDRPTQIELNQSGTTAERPDNTSFPNEYIPNGFVYNNTETVATQIWDGDGVFIDL